MLGGIARILRSFFPFLRSLDNFWSGRLQWIYDVSGIVISNIECQSHKFTLDVLPMAGWESLLLFVKNSILNGSKEVAIAAINCLLTPVLSHSSKVIKVEKARMLIRL